MLFLAHVQERKGGIGTSAPHKNKNPNKPRCHGTSAPHKKHTQSRVDIKHWHTFKNHLLSLSLCELRKAETAEW